jgi:hypothetical protein
MAIPTFFAAGDIAAGQSGTTLAPALPASTQPGDFAMVVTGCNGTRGISVSDWGSIVVAQSNATISTGFFWRRLTGSGDAPTVTFDSALTATVGGGARCYVFRGGTTSDPPFEAEVVTAVTSDATPDTSAITTLGTDRLVIAALVYSNDIDTWTSFPPTLWAATGSLQVWNFTGDGTIECMTSDRATAGSVASVQFGNTNTTGSRRVLTFALLPDEGGAVEGSAAGSYVYAGSAAGSGLGTPGNVAVEFIGTRLARVTWDAVAGADEYQVQARVRAGQAV